MTRQSWDDLSPGTRRLLAALGAVELTLLVAAQVDLARRSAAEVSGGKTRWRLLTLVNLVGPLAYFRYGRVTPGGGPGAGWRSAARPPRR